MLLSHDELVKLVDTGVIENALFDNVNGASIDIRLGPDLLVEQHPSSRAQVLSLREREKPLMRKVVMNHEDGYTLWPSEFILAHSIELFNLPLDISAEFKLKSSLARMGINQLTACWCDPGWHGSHITLELTNVTRYHHIQVRPGDKIGQMVFFRHAPVPMERSYTIRGRYNNDKTVEGVKL